jgi:hypothetical protein
MANEERIRNLLKRFADNQASEAEITEMLKGLQDEEGGVALESVMKELFDAEHHPSAQGVNWENIWSNVKRNTEVPVKKMA